VTWFKWHRMETSLTIPPSSGPLSVLWVEFETIELNGMVPVRGAAQCQIIFDRIPRVVDIEPSGDPLLDPEFRSILLAATAAAQQPCVAETLTVRVKTRATRGRDFTAPGKILISSFRTKSAQ
jgi:hypothetical protein